MLTIGHSTRTLEEFIGLLQAHGATRVVDVRTVPRSRHNPQFNRASLPGSLKKAGLGYVHLPGLGGLRHARRDSVNLGWRNVSFRGYADYMQTPEFEQSLNELVQLANQERIVWMCAEAVPWRCHRSLIADALLVRGIRTEDIMSSPRRQVHTLTPFAKVRGAHDHLSGRGLTEHSKEAVGQTLPVAARRENPTNQSNGLHPMSHDVTLFGFPLWLRPIFHSHQADEQGREYYGSLDMEEAKHPQTILAYETNGAPLLMNHGAPLRLRVETKLGFKMVKWLKTIELVEDYRTVDEGHGGYREDFEYYGTGAEI